MAGFFSGFHNPQTPRSLTDSIQLDHTPMDLQEGHQVQGVGEPRGGEFRWCLFCPDFSDLTLRKALSNNTIEINWDQLSLVESGCSIQKNNTVRLLNRRFSPNSVVRWESWARHWWKGPRCLWKRRSAKAGACPESHGCQQFLQRSTDHPWTSDYWDLWSFFEFLRHTRYVQICSDSSQEMCNPSCHFCGPRTTTAMHINGLQHPWRLTDSKLSLHRFHRMMSLPQFKKAWLRRFGESNSDV